MDEVLDFINRRFKKDCYWLNGNCYYFTVVLKDRFPEGDIYYDVVDGHFVFKYKNKYYDWVGIVKPNKYLIKWDSFDEYDSLQKKIIIRDCIM